MPFKSEKQRRWMHANKPEMAEEWEEETPDDADLPEEADGDESEKQANIGRALTQTLRHLGGSAADATQTLARGIRPSMRTPGSSAISVGLLPGMRATARGQSHIPRTVADHVGDLRTSRRGFSGLGEATGMPSFDRMRQAGSDARRYRFEGGLQRAEAEADRYFGMGGERGPDGVWRTIRELDPDEVADYQSRMALVRDYGRHARRLRAEQLGWGAAGTLPYAATAAGLGAGGYGLSRMFGGSEKQSQERLRPWMQPLVSPPKTAVGKLLQKKWAAAKIYGGMALEKTGSWWEDAVSGDADDEQRQPPASSIFDDPNAFGDLQGLETVEEAAARREAAAAEARRQAQQQAAAAEASRREAHQAAVQERDQRAQQGLPPTMSQGDEDQIFSQMYDRWQADPRQDHDFSDISPAYSTFGQMDADTRRRWLAYQKMRQIQHQQNRQAERERYMAELDDGSTGIGSPGDSLIRGMERAFSADNQAIGQRSYDASRRMLEAHERGDYTLSSRELQNLRDRMRQSSGFVDAQQGRQYQLSGYAPADQARLEELSQQYPVPHMTPDWARAEMQQLARASGASGYVDWAGDNRRSQQRRQEVASFPTQQPAVDQGPQHQQGYSPEYAAGRQQAAAVGAFDQTDQVGGAQAREWASASADPDLPDYQAEGVSAPKPQTGPPAGSPSSTQPASPYQTDAPKSGIRRQTAGS